MHRIAKQVMLAALAATCLWSFTDARAEGVEVWGYFNWTSFNNQTACGRVNSQLDIWVDGVRYEMEHVVGQLYCSPWGIGLNRPVGCDRSATVNGNTVRTHCWNGTSATCPRGDIRNFGIEILYADGRHKWLNANCQLRQCASSWWVKILECHA